MICANRLEVKHWHDVIGEPSVATAILDRLVSSARRIELKGKETLRKKATKGRVK